MSADAGVLVTGSAGGVGQALVRAFSEAGYFVIGLDRGGTLGADYSIEFDLGRLAWDHGAFDVLTDALAVALEGKVFKVLVNNAAIQALGPVEDLSITDFRATMDINLVAAFALVKVALPHLETSGGAILNMGSIHGRLTKPNFSAYATSKGALETLTRSLAVELGAKKIRVNGISPAAVDTAMLRAGFEKNPDGYAELASCHPAGRIADPHEIAELALFLAGDQAKFINGAIVDINGGIGGRLHDPV